MAALLTAPLTARAVEPGERLDNPTLEARARTISAGLRCLICQNQSIDDSNAPLAHDLRVLVRERLAAGDTDDQIERFLVDRYGEFVLLRPRFELQTYILWLAPFALLAAIAVALARRAKMPLPADDATRPLDPAEQQRLARILQASKREP
jgi:cytochrome c-type biogenesis protein CcmH